MNDFSYRIRLMLAYKDAVRTRVPFLFKRMIKRSQKDAAEAARRLKGKDRIEVAFLLTIPGMWKLDYLFRRMQQNPKYHPYIVIFPYSRYKGFDEAELQQTVMRTKAFVESKGFEYVIPYNAEKKKWDDIKKTLKPDIVFFTTPYRDILPSYYYYNFRDCLTCYVPYAFQAMNVYSLNYNQIAINLYGINFAETPMHLQFAQQYSRSHGANFMVSGYPGTEVYLHKAYQASDPWKPQAQQKKRIIWAPHHTIDGSDGFQVSTFLEYCDSMIEIAKAYEDTVQIAFKPHQLLKFKLQKLWGEEKTEAYYKQWETGENTQLEESGYVDLFIQSDAMIHDSGSFTTEYLYLNKPVMYLVKNNNPESQFNLFGKQAFNKHYHGKDIEDIRYFIDSVVLSGDDPMKAERQAFFEQYLAPIDGVLPSEKIMQEIEKKIAGEGE